MLLIVGLGNPDKEYEKNRHNVGFIVLDSILGKGNNWNKSAKANAFFYKDYIGNKKVEYLKPITFMNNSGSAVLYEKNKYKIPLKNIIVIYDDIDLPLGKIKISFNKNSGGHNGLESVIKKLRSKKFLRIRVGISPATSSGKLRKPKGEKAVLKFLLGNFKKNELEEIKKISKKVNKILEVVFMESPDKAMSLYN